MNNTSTTTSQPDVDRATTGRSGPGTEPPLGPLAALSTALFIGAVVAGILTGAAIPSPLADPEVIDTYVSDHSRSLLVTALGTLAAVGPFTIFVSVLAARLRLLGIVRGGSSLAQMAGSVAAGMISLSAAGMWVLAQPAAATVPALQQLVLAGVFVTGGPGFALFLALTVTALVGPARRTGILHPAAILTGYLVVLAGAVATIGLIWSPALALLPIARYGALAWLTYAGFALPTSRAHIRPKP